ncbi:hypothetical protein Tcan_16223 [Toxocara canis]|uniref:Uncharacterized protein n=1 Tax=Toxocara canis TaxID=6265 RepID=A0A0B2V2S9_TOXCA|nr:hypothetical protein Tcan_16223 [Toxocara canis]
MSVRGSFAVRNKGEHNSLEIIKKERKNEEFTLFNYDLSRSVRFKPFFLRISLNIFFQAFQAEVDAAKAKEEAEQRKRQYEENVRLGLVKKKGRKSKAQIEKEKKEERRRLRREKKEQRRKERREHREKEGASLEPKERKSRKERRERKREKKERKEKERKEREKLAAEKKESVSIEKKERKPRKPRDPNAPKRPRQPVGELIRMFVVCDLILQETISEKDNIYYLITESTTTIEPVCQRKLLYL